MVKIGVLACLAGAAAINANAAAADRLDRPNLITENIPASPPSLRTQIGRYQNTRSAVLGGWAAGGEGRFRRDWAWRDASGVSCAPAWRTGNADYFSWRAH